MASTAPPRSLSEPSQPPNTDDESNNGLSTELLVIVLVAALAGSLFLLMMWLLLKSRSQRRRRAEAEKAAAARSPWKRRSDKDMQDTIRRANELAMSRTASKRGSDVFYDGTQAPRPQRIVSYLADDPDTRCDVHAPVATAAPRGLSRESLAALAHSSHHAMSGDVMAKFTRSLTETLLREEHSTPVASEIQQRSRSESNIGSEGTASYVTEDSHGNVVSVVRRSTARRHTSATDVAQPVQHQQPQHKQEKKQSPQRKEKKQQRRVRWSDTEHHGATDTPRLNPRVACKQAAIVAQPGAAPLPQPQHNHIQPLASVLARDKGQLRGGATATSVDSRGGDLGGCGKARGNTAQKSFRKDIETISASLQQSFRARKKHASRTASQESVDALDNGYVPPASPHTDPATVRGEWAGTGGGHGGGVHLLNGVRHQPRLWQQQQGPQPPPQRQRRAAPPPPPFYNHSHEHRGKQQLLHPLQSCDEQDKVCKRRSRTPVEEPLETEFMPAAVYGLDKRASNESLSHIRSAMYIPTALAGIGTATSAVRRKSMEETEA